MRNFFKKKGGEWIFWTIALILFCVMGGYVFYSLNFLVRVSETAFGDGGNSGTLIERFDFVTLEQALGNKAQLLPQTNQ